MNLSAPYAKHSFLRRRRQEIAYGRLASAAIIEFGPDVVLTSDTPLDSYRVIASAIEERGVPSVFWLQDLYGVAIDRLLRKRSAIFGAMVGWYYMHLEAQLLRASTRVVAITADFLPTLSRWRVDPRRIETIENWAPVEDLARSSQPDIWAVEHGLHGRFCFLYAGTIGLKHNPQILLQLARQFVEDREVRVVVVSDGPGADWLRQQSTLGRLPGLVVLPPQPYRSLADMLACADVLVAILDADAGAFSVPSKVLTYLCAGRPILAAIPSTNLAARLIRREHAGLVSESDDVTSFLQAALRLRSEPTLRARCGENGRAYAARTFDIDAIVSKFETLLMAAVAD